MTGAAKLFLREIRIEHTLFALPFAYTGAVFAARGFPSWPAMVWITLAVFGARTAAMAANRYFDREIDARNPRTARRALASGAMSPAVMLWAIAAGVALLLIAAWQLNPLCVKLLPIAAAGVFVYPLCKRFTWLTHFVLGAVDGLAPLGAYIGIAGTVSWPALLLFAAVTVWVGGFDIIYALMDLPVDRAQGISSLPARFGERSGRVLPIVLHGLMIVILAIAGLLAGASWPYAAGIAASLALLVYEDRLFVRSENVFVLNERIFSANMAFSVVFLVTTLAGFALK
ncbi:MAG TPA: 4-hydroxybenzoate octaprenyltransferase [Candidatus Baltobacteraceae bacterium]|jgi:4-hydroxybenzoate polyprenyltransferase|nr:4-hydroxybenzoate octaprenyltransferase [Candidatus Baltobacteraceae bacterium]